MRWRRDGQLVALLVVLALIALGPLLWRAVRPVPPPPADTRLDLNSATQAELGALPGIGPSRAEAIVRFRAVRGRIWSVDDLRDVPGLDATTVDRLRPLVTIHPP
ncbi:MAG: helix-hairpin-helix domain-containing protein [Planctomycetota bacterium]